MATSPESAAIDLLRPLSTATGPLAVVESEASLEDRIMLASFIDAGLVGGVYRRDHEGRPTDFAKLTISVAGRARLAELEDAQAQKTSVGYLKTHFPQIAAWFFGILAVVVAAWLIKIYVE